MNKTEDQRNVILITADQMRFDALGLAGRWPIHTPHLDSWINQGAYFSRAYSPVPSTTAARRILLSGNSGYTCGLTGYVEDEWMVTGRAAGLAGLLADKGYHCTNVGFRNLHPRRKLYGFHNVIPHDPYSDADDYQDWFEQQTGTCYYQSVDPNSWIARPWSFDTAYHPTAWTTQTAIEQLEKRDPTRPFFLWISHHKPHSPYNPPEPYWDMYRDIDWSETLHVGEWVGHGAKQNPRPDDWHGLIDEQQFNDLRAAYAGLVTQLDDVIGQIMTYLKRRGLSENTLLLFTSDHGAMLGDHNLFRKCYAYEGSAHIPLLIRYPTDDDRQVYPTGEIDRLASLMDVAPTILDWCGAYNSCQGQSLLKTDRQLPQRDFLHGEHDFLENLGDLTDMHYIVGKRGKYIWLPRLNREQYFDLNNDPDELTPADIPSDYREDLTRLLQEREEV